MMLGRVRWDVVGVGVGLVVFWVAVAARGCV